MSDAPNAVPTPPDDTEEERARIAAAYARLGATLTEVAGVLAGRIHERCPYRAHDERCTFAGGCRNQRREGRGSSGTVRCGGDHQLRRAGA